MSAHIEEYLVVLNKANVVETRPLRRKYLGATWPNPREATLCSLAFSGLRTLRDDATLERVSTVGVTPRLDVSRSTAVTPLALRCQNLTPRNALNLARLRRHLSLKTESGAGEVPDGRGNEAPTLRPRYPANALAPAKSLTTPHLLVFHRVRRDF